MIITANFWALTKITEVVFKKYDNRDFVTKFKLEQKSNDEWLPLNEYETGFKEEDGKDMVHIKLEQPVFS